MTCRVVGSGEDKVIELVHVAVRAEHGCGPEESRWGGSQNRLTDWQADQPRERGCIYPTLNNIDVRNSVSHLVDLGLHLGLGVIELVLELLRHGLVAAAINGALGGEAGSHLPF